MRTNKAKTQELAEHFEQHAGDLSLWETKPKQVRVRRGGPSHTFSVTFSGDELEALEAVADARGATISELIRLAVLGETNQAGATNDKFPFDDRDAILALETEYWELITKEERRQERWA